MNYLLVHRGEYGLDIDESYLDESVKKHSKLVYSATETKKVLDVEKLFSYIDKEHGKVFDRKNFSIMSNFRSDFVTVQVSDVTSVFSKVVFDTFYNEVPTERLFLQAERLQHEYYDCSGILAEYFPDEKIYLLTQELVDKLFAECSAYMEEVTRDESWFEAYHDVKDVLLLLGTAMMYIKQGEEVFISKE